MLFAKSSTNASSGRRRPPYLDFRWDLVIDIDDYEPTTTMKL
jgi:hypothetical protein